MGLFPPVNRNRTGPSFPAAPATAGATSETIAGPPAGSPFSSTSSRAGSTPLAASTRAALADGARMRSAAGQHRRQPPVAGVEPLPVDLARAAPGRHHQRARVHGPVDEELAGAAPPEVVHGDHDLGPGRGRDRHQVPAQRLQGVQVDDIGSHLRQVGGEVGPHLGVVEVALVAPADPPAARHPPHGQAGLVDVLPALQGRTLAQPPGVHAHVVAARPQTLGQTLGLEGAAADEVRRKVGRHDDDPHPPPTLSPRPRRPLAPRRGTGTVFWLRRSRHDWVSGRRPLTPAGRA